MSPGAKRCSATVVNVHPMWRRRERLAPVEAGISAPRSTRPRARVGRRLAGEVAGFEFRDGGVEVFEVERNDRRDPLVVVDHDHVKRIVLNRLGIAAGGANTCEDETLAADCDDARPSIS